jgi:bifunctional non-homologous end joining protein LigD
VEGLIKSRDDVILLSEKIEADGDRLYFAACEHGLGHHRERP